MQELISLQIKRENHRRPDGSVVSPVTATVIDDHDLDLLIDALGALSRETQENPTRRKRLHNVLFMARYPRLTI